MTRRFYRLLSVILIILGTTALPAPVASAQEMAVQPTLPTILLNEVHPAPNAENNEFEFIEILNSSSASQALSNFYIRSTSTTSGVERLIDLSCLVLEPGGLFVIKKNADTTVCPLAGSFSLPNDGATVTLEYQTDPGEFLVLDGVTYTVSSSGESWSFIDGEWTLAPPTPGELNERLPEVLPPNIVCSVNTVFISEIFANPAGLETDGGEFIELFNAGSETVQLEGCELTTSKSASHVFTATDAIAPGGYMSVPLTNQLINTGGHVTLISENEEVVEYPSLGEGISYALIDGIWQITTQATPNQSNQPSLPEPEEEESVEACPEGKYRNLETNRCRTIESADSELSPCKAGQERNPETKRCRSVTSASSTLTPCQPGQERNPDTNRCRTVTSANSELEPCEEGYERNPETNRCRKNTAVAGAASAVNPTSAVAAANSLNSGILLLAAAFAVGYGIFEYRHDITNRLAHLRKTPPTS